MLQSARLSRSWPNASVQPVMPMSTMQNDGDSEMLAGYIDLLGWVSDHPIGTGDAIRRRLRKAGRAL